MISVQVTKNDLGQILGGDHQRVDVTHRTGPYVKDDLLAIAEFEQETGRGLAAASIRHPGTAGDHAYLVFGQNLGSRVINVAIRRHHVGALHHTASSLCCGYDSFSGDTTTNTITMDANKTVVAHFEIFTILPGDANGDGYFNSLDITKVERIIAQLDLHTPEADANQDGEVNVIDITKVERIITGLD